MYFVVFNFSLTLLCYLLDIAMITRFALVENSVGCSEEAQTLFENVLTSYPSRTDVWSIYVDMLMKSNRIDLAR